MKSFLRPVIVIGTGLVLALFSAALTQSVQPADTGNLSAAAFLLQQTATPQTQDVSEVGSTDEIVIMGGVIVLIVIVPIILRRKDWMRSMQS